ncbi:MAG: universal stress protein [Gemmatimonadales bacterium]
MFRTLVVPLDTSPLSERAAWKAAAIARSTRAAIHLVHVYEPRLPAFEGGALMDEQILAMERSQVERHLRGVADSLTKRFGCSCQLAMLSGVPAEAIAKYARKQGADLIVMSTHGRTGMSRAWFGSVADTLAHESSLPVLMVRADDGEGPKQEKDPDAAFLRILIALDGSDTAESILECVRAMRTSAYADHLLCEIVQPVPLPIIDYPNAGVVMAMAPDVEATEQLAEIARKYLGGIARRLDREGTAKVETKVVIAPSAGPAIVELAQLFRADLVAMTSHGRGASRLLVGSVADKILRGTHCSILFRRTPVAKAASPRRAARKPRVLAAKRES